MHAIIQAAQAASICLRHSAAPTWKRPHFWQNRRLTPSMDTHGALKCSEQICRTRGVAGTGARSMSVGVT